VSQLAAIEGITREQADALVHAGLTRLEDLLQTEESDLRDIPQIGDQAGAVLTAARAESLRRTLNVGSPSVNS
jgi:predicted RecB family nuclease